MLEYKINISSDIKSESYQQTLNWICPS